MINNSTSSSIALLYGSNSSSSSAENLSYPVPEQAIQYYRASTLVLTLDEYNNTSVFNTSSDTNSSANSGTPAQLPSLSSTDQLFEQCLNYTIGQAVPLVDVAYSMRLSGFGGGSATVVLAFWVAMCMKQWFGLF